MLALPFLGAHSAFRRFLFHSPSHLVLAGAAGVLAASEAMAADMIVDGARFVPLDGAKFDISPHTQTAVVSTTRGNLIANVGDYEVFEDLIYVSEELAMSELRPLGSGLGSIAEGVSTWMLLPILGVPAAGIGAATIWHYLQPGVLRFANEAVASTYENLTTTSYSPSVLNGERGASLVYSLTGGGDDGARFTIDPASGALSFVTAPNFEVPTDQNDDNIYDVQIQVTDGDQTALQSVAVTVLDENETPSWVSGPSGTAQENSATTSYTASGFDEDAGATLVYRLTGDGPDDDLFTLDDETGELRFRSAPDFETPADADNGNDFVVQIEVSDGNNVATQNVTIALSNVNEAPVFSSGVSGSMAENGTTTNYTALATDVDAGDSQTYSIVVVGADDAFFSIDPSTGVLSLVGALNFEAPSDANGDGDYEFDILVTDIDGLTDTRSVSMTLVDVDEVPVFENAGPFSIQENATAGTTVGNVDANDGDGGAVDTGVSYAITGGTGAGLFSINMTSGDVTVTNSNTLDFEGTNSYTIDVTATDSANPGLTTVRTYTVDLTDQNEAPSFTSASVLSIAENATSPTLQLVVNDPESDPVTWDIVGGADQGVFSISAGGELSLNAAQDFEVPADGNGDNNYEVTVEADDGQGNQITQAIVVSITDANDAPEFTSNTSLAVDENTTAAFHTAAATDGDLDGLTYSIAGATADDLLFDIDANSGALRFLVGPDADTPGDIGADNVYNITLGVNDGTTTVTQPITVTVNNLNEAPVFTSSGGVSVAENNTNTGYTATTTDDDGDAVTYTLAGTGADDALFSVGLNSGVLTFNSAPDADTPGSNNGDNVYSVIINALDGTATTPLPVDITVTDVNEDPVFVAVANYIMAEHTAVSTIIGDLAANDGDGGASDTGVTYSITAGTGMGLFAIDPSSGEISVLSDLDFEGGTTSYGLDIQIADGGGANASTSLTVILSDANDDPVLAASSTTTMNEGLTATGFTATATDVDAGATQTYALLADTATNDNSLFSIDGLSGALAFDAAPDFATPLDWDTDNTYDVQIEVTDNNGATDTETYFIEVLDV